MFEIEVKVPLKDAEETTKKLQEIGFCKSQIIREEDHYYDNAASQIKNNGEALRVRHVTDLESGVSESVITFKGKKMDTVSKSRKELETGVSDGLLAEQIFESIGFQKVSPSVIKTRQELTFEDMTACIDRIDGLGAFLELEIVVAHEDEKDAALSKISRVLEQLGYSLKDTIRNSYLALLQGTSDE